MLEFAREDSSVELVELHQLDQVREFGGAVVKAEEHLTVLFTLKLPEQTTLQVKKSVDLDEASCLVRSWQIQNANL